MVRSSGNRLVVVLIAIILILLIVIAYSFLIQPSINAYVVQRQLEARDVVLSTMLLQIQQQGYTQISDTEGNSMYLIPISQEQLQILLSQSANKPIQTINQDIAVD